MPHNNGFLKQVQDALRTVPEISILTTQEKLSSGAPCLLIDVREDSEWQKGYCAHAIHLGKGVIERDIEAAVPDKNYELILYCGGGYRSALAGKSLQAMGYENILSMAGGFGAWLQAGFPLVIPQQDSSHS